MANLRNLKKEIDYRLEEVVFDCDMAICFQPSKEKEIFEVMQEAVGVRNDLFAKAMNPAEPHNPSLVRKHYAALRAEMDDVFGKLFEKLSKINEQNRVVPSAEKQRSVSCGALRSFYSWSRQQSPGWCSSTVWGMCPCDTS